MVKEDGGGKNTQVAARAKRSFLDPPPSSLVAITLSLITITWADPAGLVTFISAYLSP